MRVLLTRERERSEATAARLARLGHEAIILPLAQYRFIDAPLPPGPFDALVFTSTAGVAALARRADIDELRRLPAWCVGETTTGAAVAAGFTQAQAAGADASGLARAVAAEASRGELKRALYPAAVHTAFDLAGNCGNAEIVEFTAYETVLIDPGQAALAAALAASEVAFLYSSRTACHLADLAGRHGARSALTRLTLIAISEKTAGAVRECAGIPAIVAAAPEEESMIGLLDRLDRSGRGRGEAGGDGRS